MINPRVLSISDVETLKGEFRKIGVDRGGVPIMGAKGILKLVKLHQIPVFWANILKQEMLSLGGDAAVSRGTLTGHVKSTDCILIATLSQYQHLFSKIKKQPFGLSKLAPQIQKVLLSSLSSRPILDIRGKRYRFGAKTWVMGIMNLTPDSFSGDGMMIQGKNMADRALALAQDMEESGVDIIDVGGESTRPDAKRVSKKTELERVLPVLKKIKNKIRVPVSIDTTKSEVAHAALDLGASVVNDVSALRFDKKMAGLIARYKAAVVLMHMQGTPKTMQKQPQYDDVMGDIVCFLGQAMARARDAGIPDEKIILDPGIGFGKDCEHNVEIIKRLLELKCLGRPILIGVSRKRFIGKILHAGVAERAWGTAGAIALSVANGADMVRVHDIKEARQVVRLADVLSKRGGG